MEYDTTQTNPSYLNKLFLGLSVAVVVVGFCGYFLSNIFSNNIQEMMVPNPSSETSADHLESLSAEKLNQNNPSCVLVDKFPKRVLRWCTIITVSAQKYKMDANLIAAVVWVESGGNPDAVSPSGAIGLMQIMPRDGVAAEFQCASGPCFAGRPTSAQLMDPQFNIFYGTRMLAGLIKKYGSLREALKAYGPMDAGYSYADKVLTLYRKYQTEAP